MNYSLSNMLGGGFVGGLDPSAKAYINAIVAAGATVTGAQRTAINNFIKAEKDASRWTLHKRLYLPIWSVAAANAIDMVTQASGTFVGGVTHAAGYIQGNGTTGGFNLPDSLASMGLTNAGGGVGALVKVADTGAGFAAIGSNTGTATDTVQFFYDGNNLRFTVAGAVPTVSSGGTRSTLTGIFMSSRISTTNLAIYRRNTSGFTTPSTSSTSVVLNSISSNVWTWLSQGNAIRTNAELGVLFIHTGLTLAQAQAYTLALKNLWETCTGLTLP